MSSVGGLRRAAATVVLVVLVTVAAAACGGTRDPAGHEQAPVKRAAGDSIRRKVAAASRRGAVDPLVTPAMRAYLAKRSGVVTAAVEDLRTGQIWTYHPGDREQTGSIIKVDILETLLRQAQLTRTPLDSDETALVQGMIEESDNDDAQDLWSVVGSSTGIGAYDAQAGLTQTVPNTEGYWGETTTSALDQIRLLRELVRKHSLLDVASKHYELGLMEHVDADQAWGVSGGVPATVNVALKNGWLPLTTDTDWEINSIGRVKGQGRRYLIAILTAHDPTESYGISTAEHISSIVWSDLGSPQARRTASHDS